VTVRLSLTARIGVLFTLISASILMGLGWLISTSVERHFVDLDRAALQDKLHLIQEIGAESTDREAMWSLQPQMRPHLH
jgi:two-component system, OmpR family, heavy metal sensor histidine kinase CusS